MTQYVYGKNVVKQLLQDGKPIHEVLIRRESVIQHWKVKSKKDESL